MPAIPAVIPKGCYQMRQFGARGAELRSALRDIRIAETAAGLELLPQPAVTASTRLRCALKS